METANPETQFVSPNPLLPTHNIFTQGSLSSCVSAELSLAVVGEPAVVGELGDERTFALGGHREDASKTPGHPKTKEGVEQKNHRSGVYGKLKSSTLRSDGNTGSKESHILQDVFIS